MLIIPAIDILGGACVRLYQGRYDQATHYDADPVQVAESFESAGARRLHLVDLDAARGEGNNRAVIRRIRESVRCRIEVGGGVRERADVEELLALGVDRIVVGTALAKRPEEVARWAARHPCLLAGIDAREGWVKIAGWEGDARLRDGDLAAKAASLGMVGIVYTDISRDGTLSGPAFERTTEIAALSGLPVILSGGIHAAEDFEVASRCPGIAGVITGKALYEGRFELAEVVAAYQTEEKEEERW